MNQTETILGNVVAKANHYAVALNRRTGERHIIKDAELKSYEKSFRAQCKLYKGRLISRPFILHADVFYETNSNDLDNSLKTLLDCLQDVKAITNDNLCREIHAKKHVDKERPRVSFRIEELEPTLF